ncbi:MAG: DegQ family serine endoprotease [Rhodovibrionaceae bacterium]|nr:DegQ family serine endoprotease [Rhodovibrionaceae bacterium]
MQTIHRYGEIEVRDTVKTQATPTGAMLRWMLAFTVMAAIAFAAAANAQARKAPETFADLAEKLLPTVVNVSSTSKIEPGEGGPDDLEEFFRDFFERRGQPMPERPRRAPTSLGSGFVIDPDGYIVTNNHVIAEADEITIRLQDDQTYEAEIIGTDEKTDIALLKIDAENLPHVTWGDSDTTRIGDWVIAIGNPFGLGGTVTAGIVSARSRDINAGPYDDFIQTDASINRGNSGGPMFNMDGEVIGINTAIFSPSGGSVGIGFAVPSAMARNVVQQLREFGEVRRGWLGVRIQTVTEELAEGLRLDAPRGALVASVTPDGPAEASGIKQGDVILRFDGKKVDDMRELPRMVAETGIGKEVEVVVWRKGERKTVTVELGALDEERLAALEEGTGDEGAEGGTSDAVDALGVDLARLSSEMRERYDLSEDVEGVVITEVESGSSAAEKGLRAGDVIVEVDQEPVGDPEAVESRIKDARDEGYRVVTLLVLRQGDYQWVAVRLKGESDSE